MMDYSPQPLEIIHVDDDIVAINKPAGLLVHRSAIDRHETRFALQLLRDQIGRRVYPVHRLDKPTSGALLFALSPDGARELSRQFALRLVSKCYVAVVRGYCPERALIDHALREKPDRMTDRKAHRDKLAQPAVTHLRRLATVELPHAVDRYPQSRYSLVELRPETGRKHQLRRHMKHIGHPIIGDAKHGKGVHNRFFQTHLGCARLLLACTTLAFNHPRDGRRLCLQAGLGDDFARLLDTLGWRDTGLAASGLAGMV